MQKRTTSAIRAASALAELILTGELAAGEVLREVDLAERLGISRTPVREAITQLVARGLLTKEDGRSARVRQPTMDEVLELYELRTLTESYLAGKAAEVIGTPTIERLARLEEKLRSTAGDEWHENHASFHQTIFDASARPMFSALASNLRAQSEIYVRFATRLDNSLTEGAAREHAQLLDAMKTGNAAMAREVTTKHLQSTVEAVNRVYRDARGLNLLLTLKEPRSILVGE